MLDVTAPATIELAAAISALLDEVTGSNRRGRRELNFTTMGGAYNRVAADATAFVHRGERFLLEHAADDRRWVDRSWAIAHPHGSGRVYPNFPGPQLDGWAAANHASTSRGVGGSAALVRWLLANRLLDELHMLVFPLILAGDGARLYRPDQPPSVLKLASSQALANGVIHLGYVLA